MINGLVRFAIRRPGVVIGLAATVVGYGIAVAARAKLDVFPEFAPPQVSIQTEAPGLSPEQVEVLVTRPIEAAINGTNGLESIRSQSIQGLSVVTAVLSESVNLRQARQLLAERLGEARDRLPQSVAAPVLTPLTSSSSTVLMIGVTSSSRTPMEQRTLVDWVLRPRLLATPGVSKVAVFGGEVRQLQIQADPARMLIHRVGLAELVEAARRATGVRGAGVLDGVNQRIVVETEGQLVTPQALGRSPVRGEGTGLIRIADLADVREAPATKFGDATINGQPGIVLVISGQLGANTKVVAAAVEDALAEIRPSLERDGLEIDPGLFRPSTFIDVAVQNVASALLLGGVLVAVVLLLFLFDLRAAAISLTAIPLSLLTAIIVLDRFGLSLNTLTLGGLAIALGEVVDDAIIDVENIARRVRLNRRAAAPRPVPEVVLDASLEVRQSVVYATFVVALVFAPVLTMGGVQGALFRPLAMAYVLATLASLLVALTVTPALTLLLLAGREKGVRESVTLNWLRLRFERILTRLIGHPGPVVGLTGLVCLVAVALIPSLGVAFLPEFHEGHYVVHMAAVPGTSLEESLRLGRIATGAIRRDPRVRSVAQRAGRAELSEDTWGTHYSEIEVELAPSSATEARTVEDSLRAHLAGFTGASFAIRGFLAERIEETLTGSTAQIVLRLFGEDLDSLDEAGQRVSGVMSETPGITDVQYEPPAVVPTASIRVRPDAAARLGLRSDEVLSAVESATRGTPVGQVYEGNRSTEVVVLLSPAARTRPEDLHALPIASPAGRMVRLDQVATIARGTGRFLIQHQNARRVETVTANVTGTDVERAASEVERRLGRPGLLPAGISAELAGTAVARREATRELALESLMAAAVVLLLLWVAFGDARRLLLVVANLPFALVGGVAAVAMGDRVLSLGSLVGFVTLFGIATRNAVMLISHYHHLVTAEGAEWGPELAIRGASERLGPILMTATVTALALLPLAIGSGDPGREIEGPMAVVILGGLFTSTLLSLFLLPTMALRFTPFRRTE